MEETKFEPSPRIRMRIPKPTTCVSQKFLCTSCASIILTEKTKLEYVPRPRRICPFCGKDVIKLGSREARNFIKKLEEKQ